MALRMAKKSQWCTIKQATGTPCANVFGILHSERVYTQSANA